MEYPYTKVAMISHFLLNTTSSNQISNIDIKFHFRKEPLTSPPSTVMSLSFNKPNQYHIRDLFYFILYGLQIKGQGRYGRLLIPH